MDPPIESALVILVPEAEVLVESFRIQYDPSAALGLSAHLTVLYPFKPPDEITAAVIRTLGGLFSKFKSFTVSLAEARQFPDVLYLAPTPDEPFRRLTEVVTEHFPETPPYRGQFSAIIPHLTVARVSDPQRLQEIATDFQRVAKAYLPIRARVTRVTLMDNDSGYWQSRVQFRFDTKHGPG